MGGWAFVRLKARLADTTVLLAHLTLFAWRSVRATGQAYRARPAARRACARRITERLANLPCPARKTLGIVGAAPIAFEHEIRKADPATAESARFETPLKSEIAVAVVATGIAKRYMRRRKQPDGRGQLGFSGDAHQDQRERECPPLHVHILGRGF